MEGWNSHAYVHIVCVCVCRRSGTALASAWSHSDSDSENDKGKNSSVVGINWVEKSCVDFEWSVRNSVFDRGVPASGHAHSARTCKCGRPPGGAVWLKGAVESQRELVVFIRAAS